MATVRPREHPSVWFELFAMATIVVFAVAGIGSSLSLVHDRPWNWGLTLERSLPALPGAFVSFGPGNRLLVRWSLLAADKRFIPWDTAVRRTVAAASLPAGADVEEWRPHIRYRIVVLRWIAATTVSVFAAISALTGVAAATTSHNEPSVWALAIGVALGAGGGRSLPRSAPGDPRPARFAGGT